LLGEAGIKASDEEHLVVIEKNGIRFGFIGFNLIKQSDLMTIQSKAAILSKVASVKQDVDILVVSMHWGNEYQQQPPEVIVKYAHDLIDAGADVIAGNHPHVVQRSEAYHDGIIFYSLGNLVFDQEPLETRSGADHSRCGRCCGRAGEPRRSSRHAPPRHLKGSDYFL
jgi:poly-gamma-glutamate synthesis protein (capsule biosynthesis protein)